jgi:hypothetical protein
LQLAAVHKLIFFSNAAAVDACATKFVFPVRVEDSGVNLI